MVSHSMTKKNYLEKVMTRIVIIARCVSKFIEKILQIIMVYVKFIRENYFLTIVCFLSGPTDTTVIGISSSFSKNAI